MMRLLRPRQTFWPLIRQSWLGATLLGVAALILFCTMGFLLWVTERAETYRRHATELATFNAGLAEFVRTMRGVESGQRGYLLSSDPAFLGSNEDMSDFLALYARVRAEAPEEGNARALLAELQPVIEEKAEVMAHSIALTRQNRREEAIKEISGGHGRRLKEQIEQTISGIQQQVRQSQQQTEADAAFFERAKLNAGIGGLVLILTFSLLSIFLFLRSTAALQQARILLEQANDELEETVQERTAALKRANLEIQRFAYIVSHDLRSPLVNIMGFTTELEALRKELFQRLEATDALKDAEHLGKEFDEAFGFIKSAIARMDRLIGAILKISREGSRALTPEPIDMNALVAGITDGLAHQVREREVEVEVGDLPEIISDRLAVEQIFFNLIDNAIKFMKPDAPGWIRISGQERGLQVRLVVEDNGRGIDPKDHQRIFELFRRSGPQSVAGEGMGLAYVVTLLRRLGGTIDVESELGQGAKFTITMPKILAQSERLAA